MTAPETPAPSGLPPGQEDEITPMGIPPDADDVDARDDDAELPGFSEGDEGDTAG